MQSKAKTVKEFLASLPEDRRATLTALRKVILASIDKSYEEGLQYGGIGYYVPHRVYPAGYHCDPKQPLPFACLTSEKNHMSLHLMCVYGDSEHAAWFHEAWAKTGKKLDMGKACIRFKRLDDLPLHVIGEAIRRVPAEKYIAVCEKATGGRKKSAAKATSAAKAAAKSSKGKSTTAKKPAPKRARAEK